MNLELVKLAIANADKVGVNEALQKYLIELDSDLQSIEFEASENTDEKESLLQEEIDALAFEDPELDDEDEPEVVEDEDEDEEWDDEDEWEEDDED